MIWWNILSKIWLSEIQSKIYLDILHNWASNILEISTRTSINRPQLYKSIPYLIEENLISKILKWKRYYYKAESPEKLKNLFDELKNKFDIMLPELEDIYLSWESIPNIRVLSWKKWIKEVFEDVVLTLNKWDMYYRYSSRLNFKDSFLPNNYWELRDKKEIQRMVITSEDRAENKKNKLDREVVYIPKWMDLFDQNVAKLIYKNKVAIIDYNTNNSFIIENKILASFEEKIFKTLYTFLKNYTKNLIDN